MKNQNIARYFFFSHPDKKIMGISYPTSFLALPLVQGWDVRWAKNDVGYLNHIIFFHHEFADPH